MFSVVLYFLILVYDPTGGKPTGATLGVTSTAAACTASGKVYGADGYLWQCREVVLTTKVTSIVTTEVVGAALAQ